MLPTYSMQNGTIYRDDEIIAVFYSEQTAIRVYVALLMAQEGIHEKSSL